VVLIYSGVCKGLALGSEGLKSHASATPWDQGQQEQPSRPSHTHTHTHTYTHTHTHTHTRTHTHTHTHTHSQPHTQHSGAPTHPLTAFRRFNTHTYSILELQH